MYVYSYMYIMSIFLIISIISIIIAICHVMLCYLSTYLSISLSLYIYIYIYIFLTNYQVGTAAMQFSKAGSMLRGARQVVAASGVLRPISVLIFSMFEGLTQA